MQRTIAFTEAEDAELRRQAEADGVSVEELIREAARERANGGASKDTVLNEAVVQPNGHTTPGLRPPKWEDFDDRTPEEKARDEAIHMELHRTRADFETRYAATKEIRERHERQRQAYSDAYAAWMEATGTPPRTDRGWTREELYEERLKRYDR